MNATRNAMRLGVQRGWTELMQSLRSPQDQGFYLFTSLLVLGYLWIRRDDPVEGSDLYVPSVALPSILGGLVAFGVVIGPAYALAMEREDGTLLRHKAVPHGLRGYFTGHLVLHSLGIVPQMLVILIPSFLLFDDLMAGGAGGWLTVVWVLALGTLAMMPLGMIIGALVPNMQKVGTWGMLPILVLTGISGIFFPIQQLWGWLQVVAQIFPTYWIGLGMRSAFLPESAAALEVSGSWRTPQTALVLAAWAVAGAVVTPVVLRRMARRQSGSQMEAARESRRPVGPMTDAVHNRIGLLRAERGVSRRELADALAVHYQTVGYLERGEFNPSLNLALRIAAFFDVPVEVIFSIEPFPRIGPERVSDGALRRTGRLTYSQFLTLSLRSAFTLSTPAPQSISSRVESRAKISSLPPWAMTVSFPAPGVMSSLPLPAVDLVVAGVAVDPVAAAARRRAGPLPVPPVSRSSLAASEQAVVAAAAAEHVAAVAADQHVVPRGPDGERRRAGAACRCAGPGAAAGVAAEARAPGRNRSEAGRRRTGR